MRVVQLYRTLKTFVFCILFMFFCKKRNPSPLYCYISHLNTWLLPLHEKSDWKRKEAKSTHLQRDERQMPLQTLLLCMFVRLKRKESKWTKSSVGFKSCILQNMARRSSHSSEAAAGYQLLLDGYQYGSHTWREEAGRLRCLCSLAVACTRRKDSTVGWWLACMSTWDGWEEDVCVVSSM